VQVKTGGVKVSDDEPPAVFAVMVCEPSPIVGEKNPHVPVASAVAVPRTVVPSISVTSVPGAAVPVRMGLAVMWSLALAPVSSNSRMAGGAVSSVM
jgi:hypothetical protein